MTMRTEDIIALAKEKLGRDITEQEAQEYLDGKIALPDETLDMVSGGGGCVSVRCPKCYAVNDHDNTNISYKEGSSANSCHCNACGHDWVPNDVYL